MKIKQIIIVSLAALIASFAIVKADTIYSLPQWLLYNGFLKPVVTSSTLQVPSLATSTSNTCVSTNASGTFYLIPCGSGGGVNSVNGATGTVTISSSSLGVIYNPAWITTSTYNASMTVATVSPLGGGGSLSNGGTLTLTFTNPGYITTSTNNFGGLTGNGTATYIPYYNTATGLISSSNLTFNSSTDTFAVTGTSTFSGDVGIGLTNPAYALDMAAGDAYGYNGTVMAQASTTLFNYFLGGAGTIGAAATGIRNTGTGYQALSHLTTGNYNTANGMYSLFSNTTGNYNTANGYTSLYSNTTGNNNTANGYASLFNNTTGANNTANGMYSLYNNTTGVNNTANGYASLYNNATGSYNTANGYNSLYNNTTGINNTANGYASLYNNTTGVNNTANGYYSLYNNTTGVNNTANGYASLYNNATGINNTANGYNSLYYNATGSYNTANGYNSLYNNTTGINNTANGYASLYNNTTGVNNTANGYYSLYNNTTGVNNTANGYASLYNNATGINNTANGYNSLYYNTTGNYNTANGYASLYNNTTGINNTANGMYSLYNNTTNIATLGAITGGSGYTPGTYTGVQMTLSSGSSATTYPIATIIASSTGVITSVVITTNGLGFKDTTTFLTAPTSSLGGTGSGFSVAVASLSTGQNNTAYGYNSGRFISGGAGLNETSTYSTYIGYNAYPLASGDTNETVIGNGAVGSGSNTVTLGGTGTTGTIIPYGNVGIGTTAPSTPLYVAHSGTGQIATFGNGVSTDLQYIGFDLDRGTIGYNGNTSNMFFQGSLGKGIEFNVNNATIGSGQAMVINSTGLVGIGTTTPATALDVNGDITDEKASGYTGRIVCYTSTGKLGNMTQAALLAGAGSATCNAN